MRVSFPTKIFSSSLLVLSFFVFQLFFANFNPAGSVPLSDYFVHKSSPRQARIQSMASFKSEQSLQAQANLSLEDNPLTARGSSNMFPYQNAALPVTPTAWPTAAPVIYPPELYQLLNKVADGSRDVVRGVYVDDVLSLPVVQQPEKAWSYVSEQIGFVTEFQNARQNGVTGLLAHNYLSGALFYNLRIGEEVDVVYGDGTIKRYKVSSISSYKKLNSASLTSDLIDQQSGERLTSTQVFDRYYRGGDQVTFQTCLARDGDPSWGLIFIIALPIPQ